MTAAILRNIRYALRVLARSPGFTLTVVLTLALGIGANTAVFSAIDAILLRPLPYPDSDRLVRITEVHERGGEMLAGVTRVQDWHRLNSTFEAISAYYTADGSDTTQEVPERTQYGVVAPHFFELLGVRPALGRLFTDEEYLMGGPTAVVLSDFFWRKGGAIPLGNTSRVRDTGGDMTFSSIGVLPADFQFAHPGIASWAALKIDSPWTQGRQAGQSFWNGIGRLKPGVTLQQARADLAVVQSRLAAQYPETDRGIEVRVEPLKASVVGGVSGSRWLIFGAVSVLLLACTNIASLMLSRAARREHEIGIRNALGAPRTAIVLQMLTEAAIPAFVGAALGLLVAMTAGSVFRTLAPELPRLNEMAIDGRILVYTIASAILVTLLCGVIPTIRSVRGDGTSSASATRTQVSGRHSIQWLLVGIQVALSVILLAGAGLLLRSFDQLSRVEAGFDARNVLAFRVYGNWSESGNYNAVVQRINSTLDALDAIPGVEVTATSFVLPGIPGQNAQSYGVLDGRDVGEPPVVAETRFVAPSYFKTLRIPMLSGELCRRPERADPSTSPEVMVNRSFVERYLRTGAATGVQLNRIGLEAATNPPFRIVGVVGDAREVGLEREPVPTVYPCTSAPNPLPWYLVRTHGDPMALSSTLRLKLTELEPLRAVYDIAPLGEQIGEAYAENRLRTVLLALFAATALSLACLGVYGTLSYVVSLRRREVGLRVALGSSEGSVIARFMMQALRVVAIAAAVGLLLSFLFTRTLSGMLYGVSPSDPITLAAVVAIVVVVAALAALLPALHASRIEPMVALRED
jgi:putative ABC transport system permease protein